MKVFVERNTTASGVDIFQGTIADVSERDAMILVAAGKVRELTGADTSILKKAMKEETERALRGLPPVEKPKPAEEKPFAKAPEQPDTPNSDENAQQSETAADSGQNTDNGGAE